MFLFFSKLLAPFIAPANWLTFLFVWWLLTKSYSTRKKLTIALALFIFVFGNEFFYTKMVTIWQPKQVQLTSKYEAGILLGGIGSFDKNGIGFMNEASDRLIEACALYHAGFIKKIVISAGNIDKDKPTEGLFLAQKIAEMNIPVADIIVEGRSRSTFENALFTKQKIDSLKLKPPYVLVTSAIHMPRAERVFKKAGLEVIPFPCNYTVLDKKFSLGDYLVPKLYILNNWAFFIKELAGVAGYRIFGKA